MENPLDWGSALPHEQSNNAYVSDDLSFEFHYFFIRKYWFLYHAKSFVIFPGGFGTLDEMFETLTLLQTGKIGKVHADCSLWFRVLELRGKF